MRRRDDGRYTIGWCPRIGNLERHRTRWKDDIVKVAEKQWTRGAANRERWNELGVAYIQEWSKYC